MISILDKSNIVQLVGNIKTGKFHQSSYVFNLANSLPLYSGYPQTKIDSLIPLSFQDEHQNSLYQITIFHQDLGLKTVLIVALSQELLQIIPSVDFIS